MKSNPLAILSCHCRIFILISAVCILIVSVSSGYARSFNPPEIRITQQDLKWIGETIYKKECNSDPERLVTWNRGEGFASLGIGHFIWYPQGYNGPFEESFPAYLDFLKKRGTPLPAWLEKRYRLSLGCPWGSRREFLENANSYQMSSLKNFMKQTMYEQSLFIVLRFKKSLPTILNAVPKTKRIHIKRQFYRVASSSRHLYALIDYVNFKGEGVRLTERYNNQGWGLLQVLEEMRGEKPGRGALNDFSRAAEKVLSRRVSNAPPERNEHQWLGGWTNRVSSYRTL